MTHSISRSAALVVIAGVATNNLVESTARTAGNLGFATTVASDATFTFDQRDLAGRVWPAEDVHMLSLTNLSLDYASICASAEIIAALQDRADAARPKQAGFAGRAPECHRSS